MKPLHVVFYIIPSAGSQPGIKTQFVSLCTLTHPSFYHLFLCIKGCYNSCYREKKEKTTFSSRHLKPWVPTKVDKTCWIYKWQTQHQKVLYIQTSSFIIHVASLYYLAHITNVWGCMEILLIHCGAGSVKVNYYRCMRKLWGLVKPHKVSNLQMRLSYCRIYFNTVCNMKNTNNLTKAKLLQTKIGFRIHTKGSL